MTLSTTPSALVWLKRDLRLRDHQPLVAAAQFERSLCVYIIEPEWLNSAEFDAQHLDFVLQSLAELRETLALRNLSLLVEVGNAIEVIARLIAAHAITHLFSHEETGSGWTYTRDIAVAKFTRASNILWQEFPQSGVMRRLKTRNGWARQWAMRMQSDIPTTPLRFNGIKVPLNALPTLLALNCAPHNRTIQTGGERAAWRILKRFVAGGAIGYRRALSSPLTALDGCSRLSAHLAYGTISMRAVYQISRTVAQQTQSRDLLYGLEGFVARLAWHCHFMQKLEDEPDIEFNNFARAYDGLREPNFNDAYFQAWCAGQTGFPMVDACMRSLKATGWLNFRMRAMLVSFASNHLWLHWRQTGHFLAKQFLDFEPGIHWSQMQMQSGTTGINTFRIYSPSKQQEDHDPNGDFVRLWVPEYGTSAYPAPIVDERAAVKYAKDQLYSTRKTLEAAVEADAVQARHGSRKSGLPQTKQPRPQKSNAAKRKNVDDIAQETASKTKVQLELF